MSNYQDAIIAELEAIIEAGGLQPPQREANYQETILALLRLFRQLMSPDGHIGETLPWTSITGKPLTFPADTTQLDTVYEPLGAASTAIASLSTVYEPLGTSSADIAAHVADPDPHPLYVLQSDLSPVALSGDPADLTGPLPGAGSSILESTTAPDPSLYPRWYNTADGLYWRWNGTNWVTETLFFAESTTTFLTGAVETILVSFPPGVHRVFVEEILYTYYYMMDPPDATNHHTLEVRPSPTLGLDEYNGLIAPSVTSLDLYANISTSIIQQVGLSFHQSLRILKFGIFPVGSPGEMGAIARISYRLVVP